MRASKLCLANCGYALLLILMVALGGVLFHSHRYCDLRYRQNEISCSHTGTNPFLVWNREISSERYKGIARSDFPFDPDPNKLGVHAYPPWHTTFFWFYGWCSRGFLLWFMTFVFLACCGGFALSLVRWQPERSAERLFYFLFIFAGIGRAIGGCFSCGNYGCILLACSVLFHRALLRNETILSAIAWALMMIKPQVGVLFFWPLFWARRYRTIALSIAICLLATLWPAYVYHTSPLELILQVPLIGKPYTGDNVATLIGMVCRLFGQTVGVPLWMGGCFLACGTLSFLLRKSPSWLIRLLPPLLTFPIWTYAQGHDLTIQWAFYFLIFAVAFDRGPYMWTPNERRVFLWCIPYLGLIFFGTSVWSIATQLKWFSPTGIGWIFRLVTYSHLLLFITITLFFVKKTHSPQAKLSPEWQKNPF